MQNYPCSSIISASSPLPYPEKSELPEYLPGGTGENYKNLSQDS
jgi:hypothetical protein